MNRRPRGFDPKKPEPLPPGFRVPGWLVLGPPLRWNLEPFVLQDGESQVRADSWIRRLVAQRKTGEARELVMQIGHIARNQFTQSAKELDL